jgi:hypothetical protein
VADRKYPHVWGPAWAPHVQGSWEDRTLDEDGLPQEAHVEAACSECGATYQRTCTSGLMRDHIARFALVHVHRDSFTHPLPRKPA